MPKATDSAPRIAVIVTRWNEWVTNALLEGALDELKQAGVEARVMHVPGAWEVPLAASALIADGRVDGIVALGCILQGQTPHAALLASDAASALMSLQVNHRIPISWGVLTTENAEQAMDRAGLKHGNKGREAAQATLSMVRTLAEIRSK